MSSYRGPGPLSNIGLKLTNCPFIYLTVHILSDVRQIVERGFADGCELNATGPGTVRQFTLIPVLTQS